MSEPVRFIIVTGMSGAGKTQTLKCLEDFGFFCVDNLPLAILPRFVELTKRLRKKFAKVALGIDIREGGFFKEFFSSLRELKSAGLQYKIIFLDADDQILLRRYSETRRRHPLGRSIIKGIRLERKKFSEIKSSAEKIINTSNLSLSELKQELISLAESLDKPGMHMHLVSFGYKHGVPMDVDMLLDVRFLPNPNYVTELRRLTGKNERVMRFILKNRQAKRFLNLLKELFKMILPLYVKEGKSYFTVGIGCTGGRHRSVFVMEELAKITKKLGFNVSLLHRDIKK
ncbi:MAG: RNase adapter RapZ [bacterium]